MDNLFKIDEFEGPLDLLLHLIKENKMDILSIKLGTIIDQYLNYIDKMEKMNLNIASSYLVMASELIEIKSRLLLPKKDVIEDDEYEDDPETDLINRLIEYQKYKDVTKDFSLKEELRKEIYTKLPTNLCDYKDEVITTEHDLSLDDLVKAFEKFLIRNEENKPLNTKVTLKEISIDDRRKEIKKILIKKRKVSFFELFEVVTKEYVVATFLAVLEMARKKELTIRQENNFEEIICEVL